MSSVKNSNENLENRDLESVISPLESIEESKAEASGDEAPLEYPRPHNDATILGFIPDHVMDTPLKIGNGENRWAEKWPISKYAKTYYDLINWLSKHRAGPKEGRGFLQGTTLGERNNNAIDALCVMGLDVDCGMPPEEIVQKLQAKGLTGIVYTTHSHHKTETYLLQSAYIKFCKQIGHDANVKSYDEAIVKRYFLEEKRWQAWLVETINVGAPTQTGEGAGAWIKHDPMPKFRAVVPLAKPFVIADQYMSQVDAQHLWKRKVRGLAHALETPIDESTLDLCRLYYLPRHDDNRPFGVWVTGGEALDFESLPEVEKSTGRGRDQKHTGDKWNDAGVDMASEKKPHVKTADGFDLTVWAAKTKAGENFDIAALFDQVAADKIRVHQSDTKKTIKCPFDHDHSNAGDPSDQGCYVESPGIGRSGFEFKCSHTCKDKYDRLEMIAEAIDSGWFTKDDLENPDFHLGLTIDPPISPEKALANLESEIEALTLDTLPSDLDSLFASLGSLDIPIARRDGLFDKICAKIGVTKGNDKRSLKSRLTPHIKAAESKRTRKKAQNTASEEAGGLPYIDTTDGFDSSLSAAVVALARKNKGRGAFLFDLDGQKVVVDGDKVKPIDLDEMQAEMRRVAAWVATKDDELKSIDCPRNIASDLLVYRGHATPKLERFTRSPAFSSDGKLVVEAGYHEEAKVYYAPTPGFVIPPISSNPTDEEIKLAVDLILDNVFHDFPFDDDEDPVTGEQRGGASSRAHALALLLLTFMRDMIPGPTPIHLITKPLPGTGASLLVEALTTIPLGSPVASKVEKPEEEENKEMFAFLRRAGQLYWKDNIQRKLQGSTLATAATNKTFSGRILGASEDLELPVRCVFVASGNNVSLADEISRRCVIIRLDAKRDPKKGRTFKHARLQKWVEDNRAELVAACLTIIQGWISRGMPRWKGEPLASYTAYGEIMGGVLDVAGLGGAFLGNLDLAQDGANPERDAETAFAAVMWKEYGGAVWSAGGKTQDGNSSRDVPLSLINQNEIGITLYGPDDEAKTKSLSSWLAKHVGGVWTILDKDGKTPIEVRLARVRDTHTKQWFYHLAKVAVVKVELPEKAGAVSVELPVGQALRFALPIGDALSGLFSTSSQ